MISGPGHVARSSVRQRCSGKSVFEEAGEGSAALEHIIEGLGDIGVSREFCEFAAHPVSKVDKKGRNAGQADGKALRGALAVDPLISRSISMIASMRSAG